MKNSQAHDGLLNSRIAKIRGDTQDVFLAMLGVALSEHPQGLPDKELQRVFELHQAWIKGSKFQRLKGLSDREAEDVQNADISHPLRVQ